MSQVACDLCYEKINESKWKERIISSKHILKCKTYDSIIATKFFEMIFHVRPEKEQISILKNVKTHSFWCIYFSTKLPKEKFDTLCKDSINNPELEKSLSNDFKEFVVTITSIIGKDSFDSMKDMTFCEFCTTEINKPLLYEHINSKEHKEIENYLVLNCMTYCELCKKEIRKDEWREHIISQKHLEFEEKHFVYFAT